MAATAAVYNRLHNSSLGCSGGSGVGSGGGSGGGMGIAGGGLVHNSQLARSLERILEEAHLSGELILTNRKLKDFPKTCTKYNLTDTVIADLSRNRFCELPEEITAFAFMETLLLYHNTIRSIPESVQHLSSLTYLDLRSNQLSSMPREICFLPLQVLLVSNNRLTTLPDELGRMERLTDLDASYNQLTTLPARIGELRSLRSLSLRSNQLMYLPRELTCLTLISLDVSSNRIASLPLEIRQMTTLVEFNLENNPLTSPPASLCVRGLVHVFKFLDTQAAKDEKGSRAGGNYDGYTTLRRAPRHNSSGNVLETNRVPRHHVDSGYSTCDGIDKRWSHDMPNAKTKIESSPIRKAMPSTPPSSLSSEYMDASLTSSSSTIVDESISVTAAAAAAVKPLNADTLIASPIKRKDETTTLHQHINYAHSSSSNGSSPDQENQEMVDHHQQQQQQINQNGKVDEKLQKNLGNIQTYREYKEALKQQRNFEISSVYKIKTQQKTLYDMSEATNALNSSSNSNTNEEIEVRFNGGSTTTATLPKSIMKNGTGSNVVTTNCLNGTGGGVGGGNVGDDGAVIPKKPIQKVIPSRNVELMSSQASTKHDTITNGDCLGYVKPNSPMKMANGGGILTNNNKFSTVSGGGGVGVVGGGGLKSPVSNTKQMGIAKTQRSVTWNHDIPTEKLSFTMRREFDRQREETELMTQLRSIIETRLKMTLPEDIASALTDGVILCHLANYVRPRSVASIHVPSPGVSKLTMARCRRNVDNFLEACRKIGVDEELICSCADVVPPTSDEQHECSNNSNNNNDDNTMQQQQHLEQQQPEQPQSEQYKRQTLPNPSAVLKTVAALIAMDFNPHHQNIRNMQQQQDLQMKLQQHQQKLQYHQLQHQQQQQQEHTNYQHRSSGGMCIDETHDKVVHEFNQEHEQQQQQQQQTATCTKQQMMQQQPQEYENLENLNSTFNYNVKCHYEYTNGNDNQNHNYNNHNDDVDHNHADDDDVVDAYDDVVVADNNSMLLYHQQQPKPKRVSHVANFFRHAKLKTFQKIKLNLTSSSSHQQQQQQHHKSSNNNHCGNTILQTIDETDGDVVVTGAGGVYQLINEKSFNEELQLKVDNTQTETIVNKYKLLDLLTTHEHEHLSESKESIAIVSKRIEFFEHSTSTPKSNHAGMFSPNSSVIAADAAGTGAGAVATAIATPVTSKPKAKNSIFSIYRNVNVEKSPKNGANDAEQEAGFSLLRHDSQVLTIILSCVFIVTFLLLVFFPLPG